MLADDPVHGVDGVTTDPDAADVLLSCTLDVARQVGGVGRVLLFHPVEAETPLTSRTLGFRLWPQDGATPAERYANAFRQSGELGYEGAVVVGLHVPDIDPVRLTEAAAMLEEHQGVVAPDGNGGIAFLGLQRHEPTLVPAGAVPSFDELVMRARQQLVRVLELPAHQGLRAETVDGFVGAARARG